MKKEDIEWNRITNPAWQHTKKEEMLLKRLRRTEKQKERHINGRTYQLATSSYKKSTVQNLAKYYKGKAYFRIIKGKKNDKTIYRFYLATSN